MGILGGTFDPPHLAHLALAEAARESLNLDTVLFIPAGDPWLKSSTREITPGAYRLAMVRLATEGIPWAAGMGIEIDREGPTYSLDTVRALAAGGTAADEWWFIIGADGFRGLPAWHEPAALADLVRFAVARRGGDTSPLVTPELSAALPGIEDRVDEVPMPRMDVSSTDIRARIVEGASTEGLLSDAVRAFIDEHELYRPGAPEA